MINSIGRFFIRATAFLGKELVAVFRQTGMIVTLVLGPFLIMLLFGVGYRAVGRDMRTLFVIGQDNPLREQVVNYASAIKGNMIFEGVTDNEAEAMQSLINGKVDLVVVVPPDAKQKLDNGEQVVLKQYHNEIDPYQVNYVKYLGRSVVEEVNRQLLVSAAQEGQAKAPELQARLKSSKSAVAAMREALQAGDVVKAQEQKQNLDQELNALSAAMYASGGVLNEIQNNGGDGKLNSQEAQTLQTILGEINNQNQSLSDLQGNQPNYDQEISKLDKLENDLTQLESEVAKFQGTNPYIMVSPLSVETTSVQGLDITPSDFFAPGVIILLMQHLAVTFAALSIVREQSSGTIELFRISPLSAIEALLGKYLSFLLFGLFIGIVLTAGVVYLLGVPMQGNLVDYGLTLLLMLFASLGMGFMISLISKTDTQAVQYAMFLLLGSVFFSGFMLNLDYLWRPVRVISWALPATYGIKLLQDIMLRGLRLDPILIWGLLGFGVGFFVLAWLMFSRMMRTE